LVRRQREKSISAASVARFLQCFRGPILPSLSKSEAGIGILMSKLASHPTVLAVRSKPEAASQKVLGDDELRRMCPEAGADDVGFVSIVGCASLRAPQEPSRRMAVSIVCIRKEWRDIILASSLAGCQCVCYFERLKVTDLANSNPQRLSFLFKNEVAENSLQKNHHTAVRSTIDWLNPIGKATILPRSAAGLVLRHSLICGWAPEHEYLDNLQIRISPSRWEGRAQRGEGRYQVIFK
jgi:hypothetical protein